MSTTYCLLGITLQEMASGTVHIHIMQWNKEEVRKRFAIPGKRLVQTLRMYVGGRPLSQQLPRLSRCARDLDELLGQTYHSRCQYLQFSLYADGLKENLSWELVGCDFTVPDRCLLRWV